MGIPMAIFVVSPNAGAVVASRATPSRQKALGAWLVSVIGYERFPKASKHPAVPGGMFRFETVNGKIQPYSSRS